jgi:MtN3 and saliva related transmembrane protein
MFNIGFLAFIFSSIAFIPQMIDVYRTNNTDALSIQTLVLFGLSQIFWFIHSFQTMDISLMVSPLINIVIYSYLLFKKYHNEYNI